MSSVADLIAGVATLCAKPAIRFSTSGTLITLFALADFLVRRRRRQESHAFKAGWIKFLIAASVLGFYALIGPTGGALLGGYGNLLGIALVGAAMAVRASTGVRHPDLAGRSLFYVALPLAAGTPWGLLALSLPACAASLWVASRQDDRVRALA
ncbi:MAG TPA: hypothetical protein VMJ70_08140 [Candidatus Sulfotelmatobacter sp.]|nr:hypothetical protein [Candidatus Sulfotelmatobacter sp.]